MSAPGRLCCKSPKLPGDKILAIRRTNRRPPIYAASVTLPSSPARSASGNEVPHIFTRKSRLQPGEFLVTSAKRLLQQYLPIGDIQQTKCDGVQELDIRNRGKRVWTQIGWGRSHLIGQPHSLQSACPLGGILLSAKR